MGVSGIWGAVVATTRYELVTVGLECYLICGVVWCLGAVGGKEEAFDVSYTPVEEACFVDAISERSTGAGCYVFLALSCCVECGRDADVCFVEVGDVQDEGSFVSGVHEAEPW
ncbi:hypothetical protein M271_34245 [Streptomyces rapamycinicus NRRL 5491]|uniref:Uncharacterized protein n=1 Tax=Streptomyces rapamycinicus TaxID=1226757 RepID=A0ABR6LWX4_9ACTN|nr:hypothetical protein M271_34245 [Streptomyces rapamycinicus NRRL 5491]MBB4785944.1 hypothetical protein [Streptomyces rapamycinicus]